LLDRFKIIDTNLRRYQIRERKTWLQRDAWKENKIGSIKE
jgi:hypothetical protein